MNARSPSALGQTSDPGSGVEFVLVLAAANAALVLLGPGHWSLESRLPPRLSLEQWLAGR